ncbi:ABC transporter ATP-binding protein [Methanosarcina mazei]|uniref:ABC transporter ATP-binding protein n=7 Tax=Methanosarcina mazei TaxID=2209 RepID=A0A0F8KVY0_METMZ|nr:ABC transporter ATP-binding protein [Methanosarcina mazei]AAM32094.1 ABC transporter, ATP-binding protein [Methanosarcina mazei Go1]AKB41057.1 ABC transporter involved in cytochrome c biogenesis, ATPase component CcmA [Methanosarcina mazei WWM610]AKB62163.1 ABC transporter involved in cytochrome c biogenesis, ATPase component CcmA [Methanosarcina mazei SarPi]AKB65497.1 ABC transporter involved in cytochrome c biogenesis, ATPase component CcmA [Methanosarcina mazei S-6]AKB69349.1 ABC transpo
MENTVSIRKLSKVFGKNPVLKSLDLDLEKGEFAVIFGPNGAGKTTLLKLISTLTTPTEGSVFVSGFNVVEEPEKARREIGLLSHESYLYGELSAKENLRFFGQMYGIKGQKLEERISSILEDTGLVAKTDERVSTFSRGMKQRLSIARTLLHRPSILLLDEPYTGLDPGASLVFENLIKSPEFQKSTKLMVSHDLERGFKLSSRLLILNKGKFVYDGIKKDFSGYEDFKEKCSSMLA